MLLTFMGGNSCYLARNSSEPQLVVTSRSKLQSQDDLNRDIGRGRLRYEPHLAGIDEDVM